MELDRYLSNLRSELDSQLQGIEQSVSFNIPSADVCMETGFSCFCPECGTPNPSGANFCCNCGTSLFDNPETLVANNEADEQSVLLVPQRGILYTDSERLAEKYGCSIEDVERVIGDFIADAAEYNMCWHQLDVAYNAVRFRNKEFWLEHNEFISEYMKENGFSYGVKTPVFIIGGHDVVPIPMVEDVFGSSDDGKIPCDMCYCFEGDFFSNLWDGDRSITEEYVRNTVSRLPLEDGEMNTSLEDDIELYFENCRLYYEDGIQVDNVMMTANASWLPASKTMSEHLPLLHHANDPEMVQDGMYVSPPVMTEDEESTEPVYETLGETGMLLFNLHGASRADMSGFYSDEGEAFCLDMINETNARVFNTVACYGARYHGYERYESMMLTALYEVGFMFYAGSLISVPMTDLDIPEGVEVHEGSGSEHLMPIFCMEQFRGVPMGEAMMRAKLEYFNVFRHLERDDFSMATMMMFSLYGNPMLRMQRNEEVLRRSEEVHVLPKLPQAKNLPVRMKSTRRVMCKEDMNSSLLNQIKESVDANISAIHNLVQQHLYDVLGLEPRWLSYVDKFSIPKGDGTIEEGYSYAYEDMSKAYARKSWVEIDNQGNIKRVIKTK